MNFETWEPVYEAILADFGYDRAGDERARDELYDLLAGRETLDVRTLDAAGQTVAVAGAGPSLETELAVVESADLVFAASTAADRLRERDCAVDLVVTDLDKHRGSVPSLSREGVPVAVHAHGDNIPAVRAVVPEIESRVLLGTTQAAPRPPVENVGGFTDGDRGAFLADHLGAARLRFPGWDFEDPTLGPEKRRKLAWAERLLHWLEVRRGEQFPVLEGRRDGIDTASLPI